MVLFLEFSPNIATKAHPSRIRIFILPNEEKSSAILLGVERSRTNLISLRRAGRQYRGLVPIGR